jgi:hypothetical protein
LILLLLPAQANKAAIEKIAPFESAIKRPYFHVKPLDQGQLTNWWAYLDYKTKTGSHAGIVRLFERCLVPCAAYHGAPLYDLLGRLHVLDMGLRQFPAPVLVLYVSQEVIYNVVCPLTAGVVPLFLAILVVLCVGYPGT